MELLEVINKRLQDHYGEGFNSLPKYRIVYASSEYEDRQGEYTKWYGGIYLGTESGIKKVPKYPDWEGCWILEHVVPNLGSPELKALYSYEPLWIFTTPDGDYLDYDWEIIEKIIYFHIHRKAPKTKAMIDHEEEEKIEKEKIEVLDFLQHDEAMPNRMYDTPLVTVPSNFKKD